MKAKLNYINTNSLWDEMSAIASEAISDVENTLSTLKDNGVENPTINTTYGELYYDNKEEEVYVRKEDNDDPLRELNTHDILNIADEVNNFINEYNKD